MFYFILVTIFIIGISLVYSGNQTLTQEVRTNMPPEDIEQIHNELANRKYVGQIILVSLGIILMLYYA
jgi:hypothetical protein